VRRISAERRATAEASGGPAGQRVNHPDAHHEIRAAGRLFRLRIWLSSAMWVPVLAANLVAVALGIGLPILDAHLGDQTSLPLAGTSALAIFGALAGGMITFTGIVFSAVFVAAQIQTSSYSPRLAARLRRDPVVIAGLALPTATAIYSLFALAALGRQPDQAGRDFVPAATVVCGLLLAVITIGAFVALVQRAFESTQIGGILRTLVRRGYAVIEEVHPRTGPSGGATLPPEVDAGATELAHQGRAAVIAAVDRKALVRLARQTGGLRRGGPGRGRVPESRPAGTADQPRAHRAGSGPRAARLRARPPAHDRPGPRVRAADARRHRDPGALAGDQRSDDGRAGARPDRVAARRAGAAPPGPSLVVDGDGTPRAIVPAPRWAAYMELGLTEIRRYGADSPQIVRRLNALYDRLLAVAGSGERPRIELERRLLGQAVLATFPTRTSARSSSSPTGSGSAAREAPRLSPGCG
jgi:hypothetical protein